MTEFAPPWRNPRMTKSQVRKYIREMEEKRKKAQKELEKAKSSWELKKQEEELKELDKKLDDFF